MKACPTCQRTYSDETLNFCLVDGAVLSPPYDPNKTLQMPEPRTTDSPVPRQSPPQSTILAVQPPKFQVAQAISTAEPRRSAGSWLVIGLALTFGILIGTAVLGAFLWTSSKESKPEPNSNIVKNTPSPNASPIASPSASVEDEVSDWEEHVNTSINEGERITYYVGTTPDKCRDDCAANPNCKAYTYIRRGAYNPADPPMCYLMSEVRTLNPSTCCFTGVKRDR